MKNIQKMIAERRALINEMTELTKAAEGRSDKRMTDEEFDRWDELNRQVDQMRHEIEAEQENLDREFVDVIDDERITPGKGPEYRKLFYGAEKRELPTGDFESFNDFLTLVTSGRSDERLKNLSLPDKRQSLTQPPSSGGFMVPEQYGSEMLDKALESEIVRPRAKNWPMQFETLKVPGWDGHDHSQGELYGGLQAQWLAEGQTATRSQPRLRQIQLSAKKLAIYAQASRELYESGINFEQQFTGAMTKALAWNLDYYFLRGDGVGKPAGCLNADSRVVVDPEPGQSTNPAVLYDNVSKMYSRLHPTLVNKAVWVVNSELIPDLLSLSVAVGVGGVHIPVMSERGGQFTMLTRPVIFTEKVPQRCAEGDISLIAFSEYAIGLKKELILDKSNAPGWTEDLIDYRVIARLDGMSTWHEPVTPANGQTQSWCVVLGERS